MHESNTAVLVGNDVELWSISRTKVGFSCLRTVHATTAARAWAAIAAAGVDVRRLDDPGLIDAMLLHLPLSRPSCSAAGRVVQPLAAVNFFIAGRDGDGLSQRARRLVRDVAPILTVAP